MDKLVEFLTSKIGYVLVAILGFFVPGNVSIFVWNTKLYLEIDFIKLIMLSFGIPCISYIAVFIVIMVIIDFNDKLKGKETKLDNITIVAVVMNAILFTIGIFCKVIYTDCAVREYIYNILGVLLSAVGIILIANFIWWKFIKK